MSTEQQIETKQTSIEELRQAARQFNSACESLGGEIESVHREAAALEKRADAKLGTYRACINAGDKIGAEKALAEVRPLRGKAVQKRSGVQPFLDRLAELVEQYASLNAGIQGRFVLEQALFEQAQIRFGQARALLGELQSAKLGEAKKAVTRWCEQQHIATKTEEPEQPAAQDRDVIPMAKATMPPCPRCKRNDDVEAVPGRAGQYRCRRAYHGVLTFSVTGAEDLRRGIEPPSELDLAVSKAAAGAAA